MKQVSFASEQGYSQRSCLRHEPPGSCPGHDSSRTGMPSASRAGMPSASRTRRSHVLLVVLLAVLCCSVVAVAGTPCDSIEPLLGDLQAIIEHAVSCGQAKGISAAIIFPEGGVWVGTSGASHGTVLIAPDTAFAAGSIGKSFTAAVVHQLAEEGALSLDDPIGKHLPAFARIDPTIPIRLLFNHRSGLYQFIRYPGFWETILNEPDRWWSPEAILEGFVIAPYFEPGDSFHYSQTNYTLLRMLIEQVTGHRIDIAYRERFFEPLGFEHAFTTPYEPQPADSAHGWWDLDGDGTYDDFSVVSRVSFGSAIMGEIFCTAEELARWARALYVDRVVLSEDSLAEMLDFYSPCPGEPILAGYGLGAVSYAPEVFGGLTVWGHSGNAPGYAAASLYLPDYDVCIGFMDNTEKGDAMPALVELLTAVTTWLGKE